MLPHRLIYCIARMEGALPLAQCEGGIHTASFPIEQTLGPLESVVDLSPHTLKALQREVAAKATCGLPGANALVAAAIGVPASGYWCDRS